MDDGLASWAFADSADVDAYLDGVARLIALHPRGDGGSQMYDVVEGGAPATVPEAEDFWLVSGQGQGEQTVHPTHEDGDGTVVVMNPDGSSPVAADDEVGATLPVLDELAYGLFTGGLVLLLGGGVVLWAGLNRRST